MIMNKRAPDAHGGSGARYLTEVLRGIPVVTGPAEIDVSSAGWLLDALIAPLVIGRATVVADLSRTQFCDSAGLQALVTAHREALAEGGGLRVVLPSARLRRVLSSTGLDQVIPLFANLADALAQTPAVAIRPPRANLAA